MLQGRPVNVKHDARCVMGKVGGKAKDPKRGEFSFVVIKALHNICVTIKCSKTHIQPFILFVICYYLVVPGHCCESMTHRLTAVGAVTCHHKITTDNKLYKLPQTAA